MGRPTSDVAFSDAVKAQQEQRGSREQYERVEKGVGWQKAVTPELAKFLAGVRSFYFSTASASGQPYVQHRGGAPGFIKVLADATVGFADYGGNKQYITLGNLSENPRAFIFVMDYTRRIRVKLWGNARVIEDDDALLTKLSEETNVSAQRSIVFEIEAWDRNCPQHIPQMLHIDDVTAAMKGLETRVAELKAENKRLRAET